MTVPNGYSARLDGHDRELQHLRGRQETLSAKLEGQDTRLTTLETQVENDRAAAAEIKKELTLIRTGQATTIRWLVGAALSGLALTLTLGLWLAERLS